MSEEGIPVGQNGDRSNDSSADNVISADSSETLQKPLASDSRPVLRVTESPTVLKVLLAFVYNHGNILDLSNYLMKDLRLVWDAAIKYDCQPLILYAERTMLHRIQQQKIQDASGEIAMDLAIMASKAKRAAFFSDLMPLTLKVPFNDLSSASRRSELEPGVPKPISELDSKDLLKLARLHYQTALREAEASRAAHTASGAWGSGVGRNETSTRGGWGNDGGLGINRAWGNGSLGW
ncbi:hypothetical protein P389DRAFT_211795 [Cystobasidium minutum MCA 4210]|uniref:uncharacterized protein n=1 Tax=Cystobasidium minutum MCA 4210 TaxID=1397322 RepID=UPI0034CFD331|eukprot:jgi/Rhomi1/211795/estExt_Genemark1.C_5_t10354